MATNSPNTNFENSSDRVVAFFRVQQDAFRAVAELKEEGFTSSEIGLLSKGKGPAIESDIKPSTAVDAAEQHHLAAEHIDGEHSESMWEKLKHFFGGDSSEDADYRESAAGMRWDADRGDRYYRGLEEGGAVVTVTGPRLLEAKEILQDAGADLHEHKEEIDPEEELAHREESLDVAGTDIEEIDEPGLDDVELNPEAARRDPDYRIQLHGEAFRSYQDRLENRRDSMATQPLHDELSLDELETSDDVKLDDSGNQVRKPAA